MVKELYEEVTETLDEVFRFMGAKFNKEFILFIGRADVVPGLKQITGTDCVIDYQGDTIFDETRTRFYLHYLNRNYKRDGFAYEGESGFDDLNIELMIYCHIWDSSYFIKALYRLASIVSGNGYAWNVKIPCLKKESFIIENIIKPLKASGLMIGSLLEECYDAGLRNAFAHSLYTIESEQRKIHVRPQKGYKIYTFEDFQTLFLKTVLIMHLMENMLETIHNEAAKKESALTEAFMTLDGVKVQIYANMQKRGGTIRPEFKMVRIND